MTFRQLVSHLGYARYLIFHPFKGFWDLKHEKRGSFAAAMVILSMVLLVSVLSVYFTEYTFNETYMPRYNPVSTVATGLGLFLCWCVSNWSFTCLNDGEGTFKEICTVTAYALTPYLLTQILSIPLSHFLVEREASLFHLLGSLGMVWTGMLVVFGVLVVHQYTVAKTIMVCVVTVLGMAVIVYIGILSLNLLQIIATFFTTLLNEIRITLR